MVAAWQSGVVTRLTHLDPLLPLELQSEWGHRRYIGLDEHDATTLDDNDGTTSDKRAFGRLWRRRNQLEKEI